MMQGTSQRLEVLVGKDKQGSSLWGYGGDHQSVPAVLLEDTKTKMVPEVGLGGGLGQGRTRSAGWAEAMSSFL